MSLLDVPNLLNPGNRTARAIIETPRGSRSKYDYEPETGLFELAGVLPGGMAFPHAFGFIPSTRAEDGDPLDVIVLADDDVPAGTLVSARLLGVIVARQTEDGRTVRNDRLIARVAQSRTYSEIREVEQLGRAFVADLERFFETYNHLKGKKFETGEVGGAARACEIISGAAV